VRRTPARIEEWTLAPTGDPAMRIRCRPSARPAPGQAALALAPGRGETLRRTLFPAAIDAESFVADAEPPPAWQPGTRLDLLGPIGRGFSPPSAAQRWLLIGLGRSAARLLPLIPLGLARGATITLAGPATRGLPSEVEILPNPEPALEWADYIAIDLMPDAFPTLPEVLTRKDLHVGRVEVLAAGVMPCGFGVCGACAVGARHGWKLACVDGPVFDLNDLRGFGG
jgi:hypothetical protein